MVEASKPGGARAPEVEHEGVGHGGRSLVLTGLAVFAVLAVLTAVEYWIAQEVSARLVPLAAIAVGKAGLIVWYFMHISKAWRA